MNNYSQLRAMFAIVRASLKATIKSPQSIFFGLFFPIVLIVVFGAIGGGGTASIDVAFEEGTDTTSAIYHSLKELPVLNIKKAGKAYDINEELSKGRITAIIDIKNHPLSEYEVHLRTSSASQKDLPLLQSVIRDQMHRMEDAAYPDRQKFATLTQSVVPGRKYRMIDFFLPGMIGFSLIGTAVFGVAFLFFSLRETLVLKRLYSTPVKKPYIILGESISKVLFQLMTVAVLILFGYYAYDFTLAHGFITFIDMMILSFLALIVFMGFGFFFSSVARNQNVIPIYANLFMFPQYFLSGTFFPRTALPESMQPFIGLLPLTAVNDAMRNVAFEGAYLYTCWPQILILLGWGLLIYIITIRVFRWE